MHELSLCRTLIKKITDHPEVEPQQKIVGIHLKVGALTCIDIEALQFCYAALTKNTAAESAQIHCQIEPAISQCNACQQHYATTTLFSFCSFCNSSNTHLISGNELLLTEIEVH